MWTCAGGHLPRPIRPEFWLVLGRPLQGLQRRDARRQQGQTLPPLRLWNLDGQGARCFLCWTSATILASFSLLRSRHLLVLLPPCLLCKSSRSAHHPQDEVPGSSPISLHESLLSWRHRFGLAQAVPFTQNASPPSPAWPPPPCQAPLWPPLSASPSPGIRPFGHISRLCAPCTRLKAGLSWAS